MPGFKKVLKYKSFTLKGAAQYKLKDNFISLNGHDFKFWLSRKVEGRIKTVTIKRDSIKDIFICISLEQEEHKNNIWAGRRGYCFLVKEIFDCW